jgi:hypothetical protein
MGEQHEVSTGDFHDEPTGILKNAFLQLEYLQYSPRIVRLIPTGKPNLFVDLGKSSLATPNGDFYFRGGHRLWHAPENFPRTYIPDTSGATLGSIPNGVRITQPTETETRIQKSIEITLDPRASKVTVRHGLRNEGSAPVELAPWALSMMRLGGLALIPQAAGDESAKLPNRNLVLWPYSTVNDPRLDLRDDFVLVKASAKLPALKLGCWTPQNWIAYWLDGVLFVKRFETVAAASKYPDFGCNVEIYCNDKFIELETLGPLVELKPGDSTTHVETWEIMESFTGIFSSVEKVLTSANS